MLAERFEVSRRTINRDIEALCNAGIPIITTQGYNGGISVSEYYSISTSLLTKEDIKLILTGIQSINSIYNSKNTPNVINKITSHVSEISNADNNIVIDLTSFNHNDLTKKFDILRNAIENKKILSFTYYSNKGSSKRRIEPYLLVFKWSAWYLYGYCLNKNDYRLFKLNKLWHLECSSDSFNPRDFNYKSSEEFDSYFNFPKIMLKAEFQKSEEFRIVEEYGISCFSVTETGSLYFEKGFTNYDNLLSWVLSFGDKIEVLAPNNLINDLKKHAENMLNFYK